MLVSSHLLSEMSQTAPELVVIGRGELIAQCSTEQFVDGATNASVRVRTPQPDRLRQALAQYGLAVQPPDPANLDTILVSDVPSERIGEIAAEAGVVLHELAAQRGSLEDAFMRITGQAVEYQTNLGAPAGALAGTGR